MSHQRGAYTQAGGDGHAGKAGAAGMSGCAGGAAAVLRRHGPGRPGGTGPVRRVGDSGAVSVSGGIGAADGPGRRGGSGPGADAAGPGAGLRPRRSRGVSAGPGGRLSCGSPHRGPAVPGEADLPARRPAACCCSATTAARRLFWAWRAWAASAVSGPGDCCGPSTCWQP